MRPCISACSSVGSVIRLPNIEIRNPKQIRNPNVRMTESDPSLAFLQNCSEDIHQLLGFARETQTFSIHGLVVPRIEQTKPIPGLFSLFVLRACFVLRYSCFGFTRRGP